MGNATSTKGNTMKYQVTTADRIFVLSCQATAHELARERGGYVTALIGGGR
jgi:hypothetical protein